MLGSSIRTCQFVAMRAEQLVQKPSGVAGLGQQYGVFDDIADGRGFMPGQRIVGAHHQHQLVAEDRLDFQAWRLDGQS